MNLPSPREFSVEITIRRKGLDAANNSLGFDISDVTVVI